MECWKSLNRLVSISNFNENEFFFSWIEILECFHSESIMSQTAVCMVFENFFKNSHLTARLLWLMLGVEMLKLLNDFWKKLLQILQIKRFATIAIGFVLSGFFL